MSTIGKIVCGIAYLALAAMWSGYVLSVLWSWFIVFQFAQAPALTVSGAIGFSLVVNLLTYQRRSGMQSSNKSSSEQFVEGVIETLSVPAFALLLGWIVRLFFVGG